LAKKKSKEDLKKEAELVREIFASAKKKTQNCAMALCDDGSIAIEADPRLPIDGLLKKVRKVDGATPKWVKGRLSVKGTEITFDLDEEMPGGFDAKFKQYLTKLGVKMQPNFVLPGEEGDEDTTDADAAADQEDAPQDKKDADRGDGVENVATRKRQLVKEFADLKPEIQRTLDIANPQSKAELLNLVKKFGAEMKSNDVKASLDTFEAFKARIADYHKRRSERVAARKTRFDSIKSRVEEITKRLNELASRGAA